MMEKQNRTTGTEVQSPMFTAVETDRRRLILLLLIDRRTAITEEELARFLAATEREVSLADVTDEEVQTIRIDLHHVQLPLLRESGLVAWNRGEEMVNSTNHVAFDDPRFRRLLEIGNGGADEALASLSSERRRLLLTVLRDGESPMARSELARKIARHQSDGEKPNRTQTEEVLTTLAHVHLPLLHNANIVEYSPETGRVAYAGHPALERIVTIFHEPDNRLVNRLDGFLGGLVTSYRQASTGTGTPFDWPTFWSDPHHG